MSTRQLFGFSPTSFGAMRLGLSTFIFHSLVVVLERVNLVLSMKAIEQAAIMLERVQPRIVQPHGATLKRGEVIGLRKA